VLPDEERFKKGFLSALLKEFQMRLPHLFGKRIVSIYFGGGTPTKWAPKNYEVLLGAIRGSGVEVAIDCEITLEANPEDVTLALMRQLQVFGINRVSIGVQSLIESDLVLLGRSHPSGRCTKAVQETYDAGIGNISIDLMFELPMQTLKSWEKCLSAVSYLPICHLSLYNLTFEPQTVFFKKRDQLTVQLAPEEERLEMLQIAVEALEAMGLNRYEISAFAKRGLYSRHNTGYWTGRPFLGFGPSAFSYWEGARFSNVANLNQYLTSLNQSRFPLDFEEKLNFPLNLQELLAIRLRLVAGVDLAHFTKLYGSLPKDLEKKLQALIDKGWLCQEENRVKLTSSGQLFYDSVASEIV
jgi:oxygen-independent coproporphyrinogen-3 oxidase